jgi:hypothetical protein
MSVEIEEEMAALEIILERHFKDLAPREVNHI